ncbi:hypothetical protein BJY52DRAFT_1230030 [Lactarius psammicola]|nr:hypothetical protein BJY52DRAFT_1230030 [Lactarius psammicola]
MHEARGWLLLLLLSNGELAGVSDRKQCANNVPCQWVVLSCEHGRLRGHAALPLLAQNELDAVWTEFCIDENKGAKAIRLPTDEKWRRFRKVEKRSWAAWQYKYVLCTFTA